MRRSGWLRLLAVLTLVPLLAAACGEDEEDEGAEETEETEEAEEGGEAEEEFDGVTFTATEYEFDAPDEMHASTINVRGVNDGAVAHEFALVKLGDQTADEFLEQLNTLFESFVTGEPGVFPDAVSNGLVGVGGSVPPGESAEAEISMSEGNWLLFCTFTDEDTEDTEEGGGGGGEEPSGRAQEDEEQEDEGEEPGEGEDGEEEGAGLPPHFTLGMYTEITVTGDAEPSAPSGDPVITIVDYGFEGLDALEAGEHTAVALNSAESKQVHHLIATDFGTGKTPEEAEEQFAECLALFAGGGEGGGEEGEGGGGGADDSAGRAQEEEEPEEGQEEEEGPPPGCDNPDVAETNLLSPGYGTTFDLTLESGHTYVFTCFIPDLEGGPPHAIAHDMFEAVTIS